MFNEKLLKNTTLPFWFTFYIYERIKQISEVLVSLVHMTPLLKGKKVYMFMRFFYTYTCLNWSLHFFDNSLQISLLKPFLWVILITFKSMKYKYETLTWLDFSPVVQDCPKCPPPVFPASPGVNVRLLDELSKKRTHAKVFKVLRKWITSEMIQCWEIESAFFSYFLQ